MTDLTEFIRRLLFTPANPVICVILDNELRPVWTRHPHWDLGHNHETTPNGYFATLMLGPWRRRRYVPCYFTLEDPTKKP